MTGRISKESGDVSNGAMNSELGRPNPKPPAGATPGKSLKKQGVSQLSTRFPYNSSKGEIRNHGGL